MGARPLEITPVRPLRVGVLGAARIAPSALIDPARARDDVVIAAVAARSTDRAREFARANGIDRVADSYDALVRDPDLDAIYNPLPNHLHGTWSRRALEAGKHVLCEKPIACNAREARALVDAAAGAERLLMEAFHYPYHPLTNRWRRLLAEGAIGEVRNLDASFSATIPPSDIRYDYALGGGSLMDLGCYCIHLVRLATAEEPTVISACALVGPPHIDLELEADLQFPGGARGRVSCAMTLAEGYHARLRIEAARGVIEIDSPTLPHLGHRLRASGAVTVDEVVPGRTSYDYQLDAFVDALRTGVAPLTSGEDAVANMAVIDAAYAAAGLPPRAEPLASREP